VLIIGSALKELATCAITLGKATKNETVFWDCDLIPQDGPVIQVDLDQHAIGRAFPISRGVVAEAGLFIDDFCNAIAQPKLDDPALQSKINDRFEAMAELKLNEPPEDNVANYKSEATPIYPEAAMRILNEECPEGVNIFVDAGNCVGWCLNYLSIDPPSTIQCSLDMGPMGWACGAVVGAKFATPDAVCIAVTGDGAFLMNGAEVSTAAAHQKGAIWIVLDDNDLHMVSQGMDLLFQKPGVFDQSYRLGNPDIAKFGEALGAHSYKVDSPKEFRNALTEAFKDSRLNNRPQVIALRINQLPLPPYYTRQYQPEPI
jgi:acetolactate synthase-1/2/3 large subunit